MATWDIAFDAHTHAQSRVCFEFVCFHIASVFECQISTQTEGEVNDVPLCLPQCF